MTYIDIHTHFGARSASAIVNLDLLQMTGSVEFDFSVGLHPWAITDVETTAYLGKLAELIEHRYCVAVGECGLDRLIETEMSIQIACFQQQIVLAEKFNKPLIIHCVRAFNELLVLRRQFPRLPWIIHGFNKNPQIAKQLVSTGCFLSFGAALLKPDGNAARSLLSVPANSVFFETDTDKQLDIADVYAAAATISGRSVANWQSQILHNFTNVFHK